jgi:hypothetical protein
LSSASPLLTRSPSGDSDSRGISPGKSIKDRLKALQDSGLSIEQQPFNAGTQPTPKAHLPVTNTASPRDLLAYIKDYNVLLIDVRHRADFDREHIKANAVVCVEPSVLLRDECVSFCNYCDMPGLFMCLLLVVDFLTA